MTLLSSPNGFSIENDEVKNEPTNSAKADTSVSKKSYETELVWVNIIYFGLLHVLALYGIYVAFTSAKWATNLFAIFLYMIAGMGITAGAHRLWAHRAYKATWQLKLLLLLFNCIAFEGHVLHWARDHRVHHKYSDTMADPYSTKRGFFFAHFGWLISRKHPEVLEKGKGVDMSDLMADPMLRFQKKYYWPLLLIFCFGLPMIIPVICWNESIVTSFLVPANLRFILMLHATFLVNSVAHFYGYKPYDRNMRPVDNVIVAIITEGEGWHNYHHTFPWDYKASELGNYGVNFTNAFIDFFAWVGWAYDLKTVDPNMIKKRVQRTGDGSHELWGWGDKDITKEDEEATVITHKNVLE